MYLLLPIAFISGILTVFSPCVLPILPIVLASGIDGRIQRVRDYLLLQRLSERLISRFFVVSFVLRGQDFSEPLYALGTGVPLYLIAKGGRKVTQKLTFFKQNNEQVRSIFGSVILVTAVMIYFGIDRIVQAWTLNVLPTSWTLLASTFENSLHVTNILRQLKK